MILAIAAIPVLYAFIPDIPKSGVNDSVIDDSVRVTGEQLYQKNCAACHGLDKQGNPPAFPSLVSVSERFNKEQVGEILLTGRNMMPSFAHLSDEERKALTGYLFGENTSVKTQTEITPEQNGQRLFVANCSSCHKAKPGDPEPVGVKDYGMKPAVLGGINKVYDFERFTKVLNAGPCYMPSFVDLSEKDKKDIYDYLSTIKNDEAPHGKMMNGKGKMCRGQGMGMGKCRMN